MASTYRQVIDCLEILLGHNLATIVTETFLHFLDDMIPNLPGRRDRRDRRKLSEVPRSSIGMGRS